MTRRTRNNAPLESMASSKDQQEVFNGILQVLQRIEAKLETHETRFKQVEDLVHRNRVRLAESPDSSSFTSTETSSVSGHRTLEHNTALQSRDFNILHNGVIDVRNQLTTNPEALSVYSKGGQKIRYGEWRSEDRNDERDEMLDENHFGLLEKYLGDCAAIPEDGRLPLNLGWNTYFVEFPSDRIHIKHTESRRLEALRAFDTDLRAQPGNDFLVVDFDTSNSSRLYRVGQKAIGGELMVSSESPRDAPWSRLMYEFEACNS